MDLEKIESQINDKRKSLEIIEGDISEKKIELDEKRGIYSRGLLRNADKGKKPSSLEVEKRKVMEASTEHEGLLGVRTLLQGEITDLEAELKLCQLFENDGKQFNKSLTDCGALTAKLSDLGRKLTEDMAGFNEATGELFGVTERAISSFSSVHGGLGRNFLLAEFLNGELVETETCDHDTTLQQAGGEIQGLALTPQIDVDVVSQFLRQVQALRDWQRTVAKYSPEGLLQTRQSLLPKVSRIAADGVTERAHRISQEKAQEIERQKTSRLEVLREQTPARAPIRTVRQEMR